MYELFRVITDLSVNFADSSVNHAFESVKFTDKCEESYTFAYELMRLQV